MSVFLKITEGAAVALGFPGKLLRKLFSCAVREREPREPHKRTVFWGFQRVLVTIRGYKCGGLVWMYRWPVRGCRSCVSGRWGHGRRGGGLCTGADPGVGLCVPAWTRGWGWAHRGAGKIPLHLQCHALSCWMLQRQVPDPGCRPTLGNHPGPPVWPTDTPDTPVPLIRHAACPTHPWNLSY